MSFIERTRMLAVPVLVATLAAGPAPAHAAVDPGWTHPGYGPGNSFYNPNESVINGTSIGKVQRKWTINLPTREETCLKASAPLVSGGRVFVTDKTGIGAYRLTTGARLWHYDYAWPDDTHTPHLALSGGLLVAGNTDCHSASDPDGAIMALDAVSGRRKWSLGLDAPVETLVVDRGIVVVAGSSMSDTATVQGFRLTDGKLRWALRDYFSPGVSAGGRLLVNGTEEQGIAALDVTTGRTRWSKPWLYTGVAAGPTGAAFYLGDDDGGLKAVRASDGVKLWSMNGTGGSIAADDKRVYRGFSSSVEALDARTGRRLWIARVGGAGQPVRAGGLLYTDGTEQAIITAATGVRAATWRFGTATSSHPVVAGGWALQVDGDKLQAYAP